MILTASIGTKIIIGLITVAAIQNDIDPNLAVSIAQVESKLNPDAVGSLGEIGIYQVRPEHSSYSKKQLKEININIAEGMRILKNAMNKCKYKNDGLWIVCYNVGVKGGSRLSRPREFAYYVKINKLFLEKKNKEVYAINFK